MSVIKVVEAWAESQPDKLLFSFLDVTGAEVERHTYASFLARADVIASHLAARRGLEPQSRVMLAFPPGLEMICALFACARAGVIAVPVVEPTGHAMAALLRIAHVAYDCGATLLLSNSEGRNALKAGLALAEPWLAGALAGVELLATESMIEAAGPAPRGPRGEIFFLQYTSGSTSRPKGVMVSQSNLIANRALVVDHDQPIGVSWLPQQHDMGLIGYFIYAAMSGGQTFALAPATFIQNPGLWLDTISRYRATASSAPNFAFEYCLKPGRIPEEILTRLDLSSLKFLMNAAEPVRPETYRRFLQKFRKYGLTPQSFFAAYGLAENTLAVASYGRKPLSVDRRALARNRVHVTSAAFAIDSAVQIMSSGVALGDNELRIVDPQTRATLGEDQVGEIWVTGPSKCLGYWRNSELTQEIFEARLTGGASNRDFLRTQDLGFIHDGEVYVCGRIKDMIIIRGQNIYPQDIEAAVEAASPAIRRGGVAAFALGDEHLGHIGVVAEVSEPQAPPDAAAIVAAVRRALAVDIGDIIFIPPRTLPKTSSGKVMRFLARDWLSAGRLKVLASLSRRDESLDDGAAAAPFSILRTRYRLTGDERITLLEAGVDSFDLVTLMHEVKEMLGERGESLLGKHVDVRLMQNITVADLFELQRRFEAAPDDVAVEMSRFVARTRAACLAEEEALMRKDRTLPFEPERPRAPPAEAPECVFLTGGTGFLGPFVLASLLAQTQAEINVLVRGQNSEEARARLLAQARDSGVASPEMVAAFERRVKVVHGALDQKRFGLSPDAWRQLANKTDAIYHGGALVNYLFTYQNMRDANIGGTAETLRLAFEGRPKQFNAISTTFIFGWANKDVLYESDNNDGMERLDFGYSQSKWASEQMVLDARRRGLATRVFRPALITPSVTGGGAAFDITTRLIAFIIKYGIGVDAMNQVSFTPADVTANNIVAIAQSPDTLGGTFHVTRDAYANMRNVTEIIARRTGSRFQMFQLKDFVPEVIRRCTRDDLIFPLVDFLIGSIDNISAMEFKRYDSTAYQAARDASPLGLPDPSLEDTVGAIVTFLERHSAI